MFIGIFSIPKKDPGSLSQLADSIPKLNPASPNKKNNAEIAIVEEGGISAIFLVTIMQLTTKTDIPNIVGIPACLLYTSDAADEL